MNKRIEKVLNESKLKKYEFAQRLNIAPSYIPKLLSGKSSPSDRLIEDICQKFNVNEDWLRYNKGDMRSVPEDERAAYVSYLLENVDDPVANLIASIMKTYLECDEKDKMVLRNFVDKLTNKKENL